MNINFTKLLATTKTYPQKLIKLSLYSLVGLTFCLGLNGCGGAENQASGAVKSQEVAPKATSSQEATKNLKTIKIAYLPITHALPVLALAQEQELAAKHGLKIELVRYGSWPELLDALNTGHVDAAPVLAELAMKAREQGLDLSAAASGHRDGNVFIASKDIKSAADLKGKTIAIPHRQSSHYLLLLEVLKKAGLTKDDIQITELAPAEMPSALASGQIAAYCVAEPFGAVAKVLDLGHVLYTSAELWPNSICCLLVFNGKFLKQNPELAQLFVKLYEQTGSELTDEAKALKVASAYFKQSPAVLKESLTYISFKDLQLKPATYQDLAHRVQEAGLSTNPPAYEEFVLHE